MSGHHPHQLQPVCQLGFFWHHKHVAVDLFCSLIILFGDYWCQNCIVKKQKSKETWDSGWDPLFFSAIGCLSQLIIWCLPPLHTSSSFSAVCWFHLLLQTQQGGWKKHWSLNKISTLKQLKSKFYRQPLGGRLLSTVGCLFMLFHKC